MFNRRNCLKSISSLVICLVLILSFGKTVFPWWAEYSVYKNPALSFDEEKIVFVSERHNEGKGEYPADIIMINVDGSDQTHLTHNVEEAFLSPDKSKILFKTFYGLFVLDLENKNMIKQIFTRSSFDSRYDMIYHLSWSKNSQKVLFLRYDLVPGDYDLTILDYQTGKAEVLDKVEFEGTENLPVFSPDSKFVAYTKDGNLWTVNVEDKRKEQLPSNADQPVWLTDSKCTFKDETLFIEGGSLYLTDLKTKIPVRLTISSGKSPVWFQDNKRVAIESEGAFWVINLGKGGIEKIDKLPDAAPQFKGKKISIFLKKYQSDKHVGDYEGADYAKETNVANEIWIKKRDTLETYVVMKASANY